MSRFSLRIRDLDPLCDADKRQQNGRYGSLPHLTAVHLGLLPGVLFPDKLRVTLNTDLHILRVHAESTVARHTRRKSARQETGHQAYPRDCQCVRDLLASHPGDDYSQLRFPEYGATMQLSIGGLYVTRARSSPGLTAFYR